jgi:hypothetical protein
MTRRTGDGLSQWVFQHGQRAIFSGKSCCRNERPSGRARATQADGTVYVPLKIALPLCCFGWNEASDSLHLRITCAKPIAVQH